MATLTFSSTDPQAEARVLVESLTAWLAEQPPQPLKPGRADFTYDANGSLGAVDVTLEVD